MMKIPLWNFWECSLQEFTLPEKHDFIPDHRVSSGNHLSHPSSCRAFYLNFRVAATKRSSPCHPEKLPCNDGTCVGREQWCDEEDDCPDDSDEKYCYGKSYLWGNDPNDCKKTHFLCEDGKCVPSVAACDGIADCTDGSDEQKCENGRMEFETVTRPTEQPEISTIYSEPQPTPIISRTDLQPSPVQRQIPDAVYRSRDLKPSPDQEETSEVRQGSSERQPAPRERDQSVPDRQAEHHRISRGPGIPTAATGGRVPLDVPRTLIRQPPAKARIPSTTESLLMAKEWLIQKRNDAFGWGSDTSRALVALSLSENRLFLNERGDTARMKKQLQILLAMDLLRNNTKVTSLSRLSLYINALLASCQNPRNFHGRDLTDELRKRVTWADINNRNRGNGIFINPITYLTLCLVNETIEDDIYNLRKLLFPKTNEHKWRDMQAISIMAYSCMAKIPRFTSISAKLLEDAASNLISRMEEHGNFGNVYSTALAVQALLSADATGRWNSELSINFLKSSQRQDGSFGDFLATYYVLPVLAGKSLAHLKDVTCNRTGNVDGLSIESLRNSRKPMHYVSYSLYFGNPVQVTNSKTLLVPVNSNFLEEVHLAAEMDPKFRFQQEPDGGGISVYSISNVPNDAERGIFWQLYLDPGNQVANENGPPVSALQPYNGGVEQLIPKAGDHIVFWYQPV